VLESASSATARVANSVRFGIKLWFEASAIARKLRWIPDEHAVTSSDEPHRTPDKRQQRVLTIRALDDSIELDCRRDR